MTDEAVPKDEAPKRTYLPPNPEHINRLLTQNKVWLTRDRKTGQTKEIPLWDLDVNHLANIVSWLDGQVAYVLDVLGIDSGALAAPAMHQWLHQTPLVKALDAILVHKRREAERASPKVLAPSGWMLKPMVAIDIETTGVDIENDRMVSFSVGTTESPADGDWQSISQIVNSEVEIPEGATRVHGISTERARAEGIPERDAVLRLVRTVGKLHDTPIVAYNARFDLTIIDRASRRFTGEGISPTYVLDPFVLDKAIDPYRKGKRTLDAVCEHYRVGKRPVHEADEDAQRAVRLLWQLMVSPQAYSYFRGTLPDLKTMMEIQQAEYADQAHDMAKWQSRTGSVPDVKDDRWPIATLPESEVANYGEPPWDTTTTNPSRRSVRQMTGEPDPMDGDTL